MSSRSNIRIQEVVHDAVIKFYLVSAADKNDLETLPNFFKVVKILSMIPAMFCVVFSGL